MLRKRSAQRGRFQADNLHLDLVGEDTPCGFLARQRGKLFHHEGFAELHCPDNGRPSVAPSLLVNTLLLQRHHDVSDDTAWGRADHDLRWKVALAVEVDERPFAKSTLQLFRAQLILKENGQRRAAPSRPQPRRGLPRPGLRWPGAVGLLPAVSR